MQGRIDRSSDRPAYKQLADILREQIVTGVLAAGAELPSKAALADEQGVSIATVTQAIDLLRTEGLIVSGRGRLIRVRPVRVIGNKRYAAGKGSYAPDVEGQFAAEHGVGWSEFDTTREYRTVPASARVAANLKVPAGTEVIERAWTHATGGVTLRVSWSYLVAERFAGTVLADPDEPPWPGGTIAQLAASGVDVTHVRTEVTALAAPHDEAGALGVDVGAPIMEAWRTQYRRLQGTMEPMETARHLYPAGGHILVFDTEIPPGKRREMPGKDGLPSPDLQGFPG